MKNIKPLLLLFSVFIFAFANKNTPINTGPNTIVATVDGVTRSFNVSAAANMISVGDIHGLSIVGLQGLDVNAFGITIIVTPVKGSVGVGTYSNSSSSIEVQLGYSQPGTGLAYQNSATDNSTNVVVVITSLNGSNVQGTFSGTLTLQSGNGPETKTISDGMFNVTIQ